MSVHWECVLFELLELALDSVLGADCLALGHFLFCDCERHDRADCSALARYHLIP